MPPPSKTVNRTKSPNSWRRIGEGTSRSKNANQGGNVNASHSHSNIVLPFRPSGPKQEHVSPSQSPVRSKYWYANSNQTGHNQNKAKNVPQQQSTEYNDRFLEWDGHKPNKSSPPRPSIANLHSFAVATNTANWRSENQENYNHGRPAVDPATLRYPAGRSSQDFGRDVSSMDLITRNTEADKMEPANFRGDLVRQPAVTKHRVSEHEGNFQWPAAVQQRDEFSPSKTMQELGLDGKKYKAVGDAPTVNLLAEGESEYERRLAKLRHKQKDISSISLNTPAAGRPSKTKDEDLPNNSYYSYDMGTSEYKMKFKEWPMGEHPMDQQQPFVTLSSAAPTSRVFTSAAGDAYSNLRQASLYRESFPAYDLQVMNAAIPKVDGRANESNKPPSFAWSLVDGEKPTIPPEHHDPAVSQMGESEYTRKFHWPTAETYQHVQQNRGSKLDNPDSLSATLFPTEAVSHKVEPLLSEYRQQFYEKNMFNNDIHPVVSPKRESNAPKQFAWALQNANGFVNNDEDDNGKIHRLRPVTSDLSEHTNKYKWPMGTEPFHIVRKPDENHELKVGKVYALDEEQRDPRNWASEYDEKYTKLRQRQKELAAAAAANSPIAGVPSQARPAIPSNFAWKETDGSMPPPPSRSPVKHVSPEHFHTEYEDKFLAWKNTQAETSAKRDDGSMSLYYSKLNLFEAQPHAQGPAGTKSEYDDNFRKNGNDNEHNPYRGKGKTDSDVPPQFAWPLLDENMPRPPPVPVKPSKPLEKSEYETKFLWPTNSQPVKSFKPEKDPKFIPTAPMATEEDATSATWKSEAQDPNHPQKHSAQETKDQIRPAGLVQVRDVDVPSFFAWADAEELKSVTPVSRPTEQPCEIVKSEMQSEFRGHSPKTAPPAKICRPAVDGKVTKDTEAVSREEQESRLTSEYQANFISADGKEVSLPTAGVATHVSSYKPPQFAWPRVDPPVPPSDASVKKSDDKDRKFSDSTEHGSKYLWPTAVNRPNSAASSGSGNSRSAAKAHSSASIDHFEGSVTLMQQTDQGKPSDWCSEYDARCADVLRKQSTAAENVCKRSTSAPPAMRASCASSLAPPFFVWSAAEAAAVLPPPVPMPKPVQDFKTETSEYRDQFHSWDIMEEETSHLRGTQKARPEAVDKVAKLLCDPPTAPPTLRAMKSEYDANFSQDNTTLSAGYQDGGHHIVTYRDVQRTTLPCTNLDKYTPQVQLPSPSRLPVKVNPNAAMQFRTEYSDHFTWHKDDLETPANKAISPNSKTSKKKNPTQKMKQESVAVKRSICHRSDANKENPSSTMQTTFASTNQVIPPASTEYRRQFSWPDAARKPNDIDLEREGPEHSKIVLSEAQRRQKLTEQKKRFKLMSKTGSQMAYALAGARNNHYRSQPYLDGKDHSTVFASTFGRAERFPGDNKKNLTTSVYDSENDDEKHLNSSGFTAPGNPLTSTLISQDSLNNSNNNAQSKHPSTAGTSTTGTVISESECASSNQQSMSSSSAGRPAVNKVMPSSPVSISTTPSSPPMVSKDPMVNPTIPGLRDHSSYAYHRSRSVPNKRFVSSMDNTMTLHSHATAVPFNPVLMHRRYPSVSDRQRTRWSTETRDSFTWTNKTSR